MPNIYHGSKIGDKVPLQAAEKIKQANTGIKADFALTTECRSKENRIWAAGFPSRLENNNDKTLLQQYDSLCNICTFDDGAKTSCKNIQNRLKEINKVPFLDNPAVVSDDSDDSGDSGDSGDSNRDSGDSGDSNRDDDSRNLLHMGGRSSAKKRKSNKKRSKSSKKRTKSTKKRAQINKKRK